MGRITFTADTQHQDIIGDVENEDTIGSKSEAVRECITRYAQLQQRESELQQQVDELQTEVDRLQNKNRLILEDREEKKELVKYAERERTISERWHQAGFTTRMKWRLFGMPDGEADA